MFKVKRSAALAAAALALGTTGVLGTASTANAATPCGPWINIGDPGTLRYGGMYAGEVEQEFQPYCGGGGQIKAHFQWAGPFQTAYPGMLVSVDIQDSNPNDPYWGPSGLVGTGQKDVYSYPVDVHTAKPDVYQAKASLTSHIYEYCWGAGSMHDYSNGSTWWGPSGNC